MNFGSKTIMVLSVMLAGCLIRPQAVWSQDAETLEDESLLDGDFLADEDSFFGGDSSFGDDSPFTGGGGVTTTPPPPAGDGGAGELVPTPRNNVRVGALGARRPGNWVLQGLSTHSERQQVVLKQFGGATPLPEGQLPPPRQRVFLLAFLETLFDVLQTALDQFVQSIELSQQLAGPDSALGETTN